MHLAEPLEVVAERGVEIEPADLADQPAGVRQDGSLLGLDYPPIPLDGEVLSPFPVAFDAERVVEVAGIRCPTDYLPEARSRRLPPEPFEQGRRLRRDHSDTPDLLGINPPTLRPESRRGTLETDLPKARGQRHVAGELCLPWLRSHGKGFTGTNHTGVYYVLQCGRGFAATERPPSWCRQRRPSRFNEAVASQPRKAWVGWMTTWWPWSLQRGRGFSATEGEDPNGNIRPDKALQRGRGFSATDDPTKSVISWEQPTGFNVAVASQPRKDAQHLEHPGGDVASTRPWLPSHGRADPAPDTLGFILLQRGRGFAATEGAHSLSTSSKPRLLQRGRGFAATKGPPSSW